MSALYSSQIAYLENLLKMYNDEICRLQKAELSVDDLGAEDSLYIQEHKLKRKVRLESNMDELYKELLRDVLCRFSFSSR